MRCFSSHDLNKIALCPSVLRGVGCFSGDKCDLSHVASTENSPTCLHFLAGKCTRPKCAYIHAQLDPGAPLCSDFSYGGYCENGANCGYRHLRQCADYTNTGVCMNIACRLPHLDRASEQKRRLSSSSGSGTWTAPTLVGSPMDHRWNDEWKTAIPAAPDAAQVADPLNGPGEFSQQQDFIPL